MRKKPLKIGDVVQINPGYASKYAGCFIVVTEPREWGAIGYIKTPEKPIFCTCLYRNIQLIGRAEWMQKNEDAEDAN